MPCSDGGYNTHDNSAEVQKIHNLTRMLCGLCELVESTSSNEFHNIVDHIPGLAKWWDEHKEADRKREAIEKAAMANYRLEMRAYNKLSPDDRLLLGVRKPQRPC